LRQSEHKKSQHSEHQAIAELLHFRLKVWQHRTSLMQNFAHFVILHQLKQWLGVPNVVIFCVPIVSSTINLQNYLEIIQAIALIGEGSQNEQNFASDWFDVAILLV
jgi:hypothetical protein